MTDLGSAALRGNRKYSMVRCPFHDDRRASAAVYHEGRGGPWFVCYACHTSMPLSVALEKIGIENFEYQQSDNFELDLFDNRFVLRSPTDRGLHYLAERGVDVAALSPYVGSTDEDDGVAFGFGLNQKYIGAQIRVFPERQRGDVRYILRGKRTSFFGNYEGWKGGVYKKLVVVEKAFGALKVQQASDKFGLGIASICSAGSNIQKELFVYIDADTTFIVDNDAAGRKAGEMVKRMGYRVLVPTTPIDEWCLEKIGDTLRRSI